MDVIWFIAGLVIGAVVGILLGYCIAYLAILRKASIKEWEIELKPECDDDANE